MEVIVTAAIGGVLITGIGSVVVGALDHWDYSKSRQELLYQGTFAMNRIVDAVNRTRRLLVPLADNPATGYNESLRDILAVTLDPTLDRDADGFADADNDKDGKVDEDIPPDNTNDGAPGIAGVDDDNDGTTDNGASYNNDEEGLPTDDWINGIDDDGDGSVDEDIPRINNANSSGGSAYDNDGDGLDGEDWLDPVVYFISADGKSLMERLPNVNPTDGSDFTNRIIAEADTVSLTVERLASSSGDREELLDITLQLVDDEGGTVNLNTQVQIGVGG